MTGNDNAFIRTMQNTSLQMEDIDYTDDYSRHLYVGYSFERPIYLYIWEILVIVTSLINVVVISVLLRKKLRNPTYMILVAISVSDSLTGLVTLPSYISVFQHFHSTAVRGNTKPVDINFTMRSTLSPEDQEYYDLIKSKDAPVLEPSSSRDGYFLSENLCDGFMISKFFLSKSFHTVSVWLTVFLALQRFLTMYSRFGMGKNRLTMKKVIVICVVLFVLAPCLHVYHLFKDSSPSGHCKWTLHTGTLCDSDCIYLWFVTILGHLLPAVLLICFTAYFVYRLRQSTKELQIMGSRDKANVNTGMLSRQRDNRRASRVVTAILAAFLIPEVPYAGYLLYLAIAAHADIAMSHKANRAIHATYEILLVLSFNANFYIYTLINKDFRKVLKATILVPAYNIVCSVPRTLGYVDSFEVSQNTASTGVRLMSLTGTTNDDSKHNK